MTKIEFTLGDPVTEGESCPIYPFLFTVAIKKTWYNCLRFWLFFKFFPFEFKGWIKEE